MKLRKTSLGNYFGYYGGHYVSIYRRPHGKWCAIIGRNGEWLHREGYHGTSLPTVKDAKQWVKSKI